MIRKLQSSDVAQVVTVHLLSFPGFFLSFLGFRFLSIFYSGICSTPEGVAFVYLNEAGVPIGFIAGSANPSGFYKRLLKRDGLKFAIAAIIPVFKKPAVFWRLFRALFYPYANPIGDKVAGIFSIGVIPEAQGKGAGVELVKAFLCDAHRRGCSNVYLTTDLIDNDAVNRFYSKLGFTIKRQFVTPDGREMNEYWINLVNGFAVVESKISEFIPFSLPDIGEEEIAEVIDSLRSGWISTGPKTKKFEQYFSGLFEDGAESIAVNSATAGLHIALEAIGVSNGDEVITTPYTFTATAEVIRYLGAHPVFVDIDPATLNIDPKKLEVAITNKTKAIMPVHFAGLACDMTEIMRIARKHNLKVIEDAAHALPTRYKGKLIGDLESDAAVFSFYATKTITTGEGGMVVTRNAEIAARCKMMRLHGISRDAFDRYTTTKPSWHYEVVAPGFKYNMTDMAASMGIHQLKKAWLFQQRRQTMAERYDRELAGLPITFPPHPDGGDVHAWHLYVLQLQSGAGISRDKFIEEMSQRGIGCSVHFIPLHLHPYWRDAYKLKPDDYPNSLAVYQSAVSLPLYTKMTDDDQARVIEAIKDILN